MIGLNRRTMKIVRGITFDENKVEGTPLPYGHNVGEEVTLTNVVGDTLDGKLIDYSDDFFYVELDKSKLRVAAYKTMVSKKETA